MATATIDPALEEAYVAAYRNASPQKRAERKLRAARSCAVAGDKQGFFDAIGYNPAHEAQRAFHASRAPRRVMRFGRRGGKTLACSVELLYLLLQPNKRAWVVAPTHDDTERIWREVCHWLFDVLLVVPDRRSDSAPRELKLPWGSVLCGKSTEHGARTSLVGDSLDALVWDECALSPGSVWEQRMQPNLADREGWVVFASTPEGKNHFYDKWVLTETDPMWAGFFAPSEANPTLPRSVIEEARRTWTPEAFGQAYEAKFTVLAGRVYAEWDEDLHVALLHFEAALPLSLTFDFGTTDSSPFVCLWLQETPENVLHVLHELVVPNRTTYECAQLVTAEHRRLRSRWPDLPERASWATGDPAAKDGRLTLMQQCPVLPAGPIVYHTRDIESGIEIIRQRLRPQGTNGPVRLQVNQDCTVTREEFMAYRRREHREGTDVKPAPIKDYDHCLDALRYYEYGKPLRRKAA